jgi:hypothetical protein
VSGLPVSSDTLLTSEPSPVASPLSRLPLSNCESSLHPDLKQRKRHKSDPFAQLAQLLNLSSNHRGTILQGAIDKLSLGSGSASESGEGASADDDSSLEEDDSDAGDSERA